MERRGRIKEKLKRAGRWLWLSDRMTMFLMVLVVAVSLTTVVAKADSSTEVNHNIGGMDMTISRFSELIADTFNDNVAQGMTVEGAVEAYMNTVDNSPYNSSNTKNSFGFYNVGNILGYAGARNDSANSSNVWTDGTDASSKMITLETIWSLHDAANNLGGTSTTGSKYSLSMTTSPLAQYIVWGSMLNYLGIDEFRNATSSSDGVRMVIGYTAYVLFILAYSAANIMNKVVEMLQSLNVFMWVWEGTTDLIKTFLDVEDLRDVPFLKEMLDAFDVLMDMRWVILGILVILFVASITVWKTQGYNRAATVQQKGRGLVYRLIVMCIGIPLCGMIYTEGLDIVGRLGEDSEYAITGFIFQEFMDFEGWTVRLTQKDNGMLASFKTGNDAVGPGIDINSFKRLYVEYDSAGHNYTILAPTSKKLWFNFGHGGNNVNDNQLWGPDGQPTQGEHVWDTVDASRFVYAVNQAVYGTAVTGVSNTASYVNSFYGEGSEYKGYDEFLSSSAKLHVSNPDSAFKACRDLILNYARSNTVTPDILNQYYIDDMRTLRSVLPSPVSSGEGGEGGEGGTASSSTGSGDDASNEAGSINGPVMERLFGSDASQQRIWSFVQIGSPWIYPSTDTEEVTLYNNIYNGEKVMITATLRGLSAASSGQIGTNAVLLKGPNGEKPIMTRTLSNELDDMLDGTGDVNTGYSTRVTTDPNVGNTPGYSTGVSTGAYVTNNDKNGITNYTYKYVYNLDGGGMSPLAMYNYLHSKFENGTLTVYSPELTTNAGVSTMHYAVTTPYSGIPEMIQLLFTLSILFSLGIIGWVFGVSLLMNSIVQMCKALPTMFKMLMGSVQGFVEGMLIAFSVIVELLVTVALYTLSVKIIDFLIRLIKGFAELILSAFTFTTKDGTTDVMNVIDIETYSIVSGLLSTAVILWGTFQLIKWRQAITISIKSIITNMMNKIFGTSAAMPTGASSGLMKGAAALAAGGMIAGSLAEQGTLDDVVNDLTQSDLGSSVHDKLAEGDYEGALEDIKDYANGTYVSGDDIDRGASDTWDASQQLGDGYDSLDGAFKAQPLLDWQQEELDEGLPELMEAKEKYEDALKNGTPEEIEEAKKEYEGMLQERSEKAAEFRRQNGEKAKELGVPNYAEYVKQQQEEAANGGSGLKPIEGADIPEDPGKELDPDAQMAYDAARDGDAESLRSAAGIYDENGLDEDQRAEIDQMVADGATEGEVAERVQEMAEENFGEHHAAVVDKMNEAAGRGSAATYGSADNSDGNARTMSVASAHDDDGSRAYAVTDNNSNDGTKTFSENEDGELAEEFDEPLPEMPGDINEPEAYQAAMDGDIEEMQEIAEELDENGLTKEDQAAIDQMVMDGASPEEVASEVNRRATANLGPNHKQAMERINSAARRGNTAAYGERDENGNVKTDAQGNLTGMSVSAKKDALEGTDWSVVDNESGEESRFQGDGEGGLSEIPTDIGEFPSKELTPTNQKIYDAARDGDVRAMRELSNEVNNVGINHEQEESVAKMVASGASEAEVAAAIDNYAQQNFGDDYKQVVDRMNEAAGRDSTVSFSTSTGGGPDGSQPRTMRVTSGWEDGQAAYAVEDLASSDGAHTVGVEDVAGQSVYTDDANGDKFVTADFGAAGVDAQTYGDIRNQVDAVALNSGGMLTRGSGHGAGGRDVTVSEAASQIASNQSQQYSTGDRAQKTNMGGANGFAGLLDSDIEAYNKAAETVATNAGLDPNSFQVDTKTGFNTTSPDGTLAMMSTPVVTGSVNYGSENVPDLPAAGNGGPDEIPLAPNLTTAGVNESGYTFQTGGTQPMGGAAAGMNIGANAFADPNAGMQPTGYTDPNAGAQVNWGNAGGADSGYPDPNANASWNTGAGTGGNAGSQVNWGNAGNADPGYADPNAGQNTPYAEVPQANNEIPTGNNAGGFLNSENAQKVTTVVAAAAAAKSFFSGGGATGALASYNAVSSIGKNITETFVPEGGTGGNNMQYTEGGNAQHQNAGNGSTGSSGSSSGGTITYSQPVEVPSANGGTSVICRGSNGVVYGVDGSGQPTSQVYARDVSGNYVAVNKDSSGDYRSVGTGMNAVQMTDGSHIIVTTDASGHTVMANPDGTASDVHVTRTANGYQAAATDGNGNYYTVNESGAMTGSKVVSDGAGNSYSVVRGTDNQVYLANSDGSASNVKMAQCGDGSWTAVMPNGQTENGYSATVTMSNGRTYAVEETEGGGIVIAGSNRPLTMTADGWAECTTGSNGVQTIINNSTTNNTMNYAAENSCGVAPVQGGGSAYVGTADNGITYMSYSDGSLSDVPMARTSDNTYAPVTVDASGVMHTDTGELVVRTADGGYRTAVYEDGNYYLSNGEGGRSGAPLGEEDFYPEDDGTGSSNVEGSR